MATPDQRRRKKLAKQRSKHTKKRREQARHRGDLASVAGQMRRSCRFPVTHSMIGTKAFTAAGMSTVLVARTLGDRSIAVAVFLIDLGCLGVKNTFARCVTASELAHIVDRTRQAEEMQDVEPGIARSLVDQSIEYARHNGFAPHADFSKSYPIFGDIKLVESDPPFVFGGEDGKPIYISGPHDSPERQTRIMQTLEDKHGADNFGFMYSLSASEIAQSELDALEFEDID